MPATAQDAGDEYTCSCGTRWIAVRQHWWSRKLRWERVLFALPSRVARGFVSGRPSGYPREPA